MYQLAAYFLTSYQLVCYQPVSHIFVCQLAHVPASSIFSEIVQTSWISFRLALWRLALWWAFVLYLCRILTSVLHTPLIQCKHPNLVWGLTKLTNRVCRGLPCYAASAQKVFSFFWKDNHGSPWLMQHYLLEFIDVFSTVGLKEWKTVIN